MSRFTLILPLFLLLWQVSVSQDTHRLWGTASTGGRFSSNLHPGNGFIYSVNADGSDFSIHKEFSPNPDGSIPQGKLTQSATGDFFGTTLLGGENDWGALFKLSGDGMSYTKLFDFSPATGGMPVGSLAEAPNGRLFGVTTRGGSNDHGVIFSISATGSDFQSHHNFGNNDIIQNAVIFASDGKLYGTFTRGGGGHRGILYRMNQDGTGFQELHSFAESFELHPKGPLFLEAQDGSLLGSLGNILYKINKDGTGYEVIHAFNLNGDSREVASVIQLPSGVLLGTTTYGGTFDSGQLFSVEPNGLNYTILHNFSGVNSYKESLVLANNGKLYGAGFNNDQGLIYEIETDGSGFTPIYQYGGFENGLSFQSIIESADGYLFGVAKEGGASKLGTIFKITKAGAFTKLKDFPQEGADPESALTLASNGKLYGCTTIGGTGGWGTVFRIEKDGTGFTTLFNFDGLNGRIPVGRLVEMPDGFLYGTTEKGGNFLSGNIFRVDLEGNNFATVKSFEFHQGNPNGELTKGVDGNLYGVTSSDLNVKGLFYKISPNGTDFTVLIDFATVESTLGAKPSGIRQLASGDFIGLTTSGGGGFAGTIFKTSSAGTNSIKLKDLDFNFFNVVSKNTPLEASNGKLYGTNFFNNSVYSFESSGANFQQFNNSQGFQPYGSLLELNGSVYGAYWGKLFKFDLAGNTFTNFNWEEFNTSDHFIVLPMGGLLAVEKQSQTISFDPIASPKNYDAPNFNLAATASSGLPITFTSSDPAVATVSGNSVTIVGPGQTTITAVQAGTMLIGRAASQQTLVVSKKPQTITFSTLPAVTYGAEPFPLSASASSTLLVSYASSDLSIATISGSTVTIVGAGTTTITARQEGNNNYNAAPDVEQALTINRANQSIAFNSLSAQTYGDAPFVLSATASSTLPVSYTSSDETVATISGNTVTIVGAGTTVVTAKQEGDGNYNPAAEVTQTLTVNKANQTISYNSLATKTYGDASFDLSATATSGLPIMYTSSNETVATISANIVTILGAGTAAITATQAGNNNYEAAPEVAQVLTVNKGNQAIAFTSLPAKAFGDAAFSLTASTTSGLPVTFASSNETVATITGSTVTILGAGSTLITASQGGNANYAEAPSVTQTLVVDKIGQAITFTSIPDKTLGGADFDLSATATSNLPVSFSTTSDKVSIANTTVSLLKAGRVVIKGDQAGNANHDAAPTVEQSFCINPPKPAIALTNVNTEAPILTSSNDAGNQWYLNGAAIVDGTQKTLTATLSGTYTVQTKVDDCAGEISEPQVLIITGDLKNMTSTTQLELYPNPVQDYLVVEWKSDKRGELVFQVIDALGRTIEVGNGYSNQPNKIPMGSLKPGTYFLRVQNGREVHSKIFLKQ